MLQITFKVLIILHYLIREGNTQRVAETTCLRRPQIFDISKIKNKKLGNDSFFDCWCIIKSKDLVPGTIQNIYLYKTYLDRRATVVDESQMDYTKSGTFRRLTLSEGLFEETIRLQQLLACALSCKVKIYKREIDDIFMKNVVLLERRRLCYIFICLSFNYWGYSQSIPSCERIYHKHTR